MPWASLRRAEHEDGKRELSERELEVLLLAARGLSNRQIAYHLQLSETTVKRHLANLYPKMGVHSRSEATRKAFTEGWFPSKTLPSTPETKAQTKVRATPLIGRFLQIRPFPDV